jgi:nucleoside-diphosphate-sugar epimerase
MNFEKVKILLLGAGGFIGTNLTERLLKNEKYKVTAVDIDTEKLQDCLQNKNLIFKKYDIRNVNYNIEELIKNNEIIIDLIAIANPSLYVSNPIDVFNLNFTENLRIIDLCLKYNKRIIQFSTCEVYGKTVASVLKEDPIERPFPFNEDDSPMIMGPIKNHRWIYACAKQLLERILHAYGIEKELNYTIIRPFNFIGPRIDFLPSEKSGNPRVFSHFMNGLLYGTPIQLVDGGFNYRAYTYIDDAIDCVMRIIENPNGICDREIFNIGTPENEVSIRELANIMKEIFNKNFRQTFDPDPKIISVRSEDFYGRGYEDCDRRIPDVTKARTKLNWYSKHDIHSVIFNTMEYFVKKHRAKYK